LIRFDGIPNQPKIIHIYIYGSVWYTPHLSPPKNRENYVYQIIHENFGAADFPDSHGKRWNMEQWFGMIPMSLKKNQDETTNG
jgi:hypothetical protein